MSKLTNGVFPKYLLGAVFLWWVLTTKEIFFVYDAETLILICFVLFLRFAYMSFGGDIAELLDERKDLVVAEYNTRAAIQTEALKDLQAVYGHTGVCITQLEDVMGKAEARGLSLVASYESTFEHYVLNEVGEALQSFYIAEQSLSVSNQAVITNAVFSELSDELASGKWNFDKTSIQEVIHTLENSKLD